MGIWVAGTSKQNFQKNKVVPGKTPFFVIGPFCTTILFLLTLVSHEAVLYGNDAFSIFFNLKTALQFFEIGFRFPKNLFQS